MTRDEALAELYSLYDLAFRQANNPYNHSRNERHVKVIFQEMAGRIQDVMYALRKKTKIGRVEKQPAVKPVQRRRAK